MSKKIISLFVIIGIVFSFYTVVCAEENNGSSTSDGFTIDGYGKGSIVGTYYTIPAHSCAEININLNLPTIEIGHIDTIFNNFINMLDGNKMITMKNISEKYTSGECSMFWVIGKGQDSSTSVETYKAMSELGLNEDQINTIVEGLYNAASQMVTHCSTIKVNNSNYNYPVVGNAFLYSVYGKVTFDGKTKDYRIVSDKASINYDPITDPNTLFQ